METYDAYVGGGDDRPFDSDYMGYDPRLASQRFENFGMTDSPYSEADHEETKDLDEQDFKPHHHSSSSINGFDHLGVEVPPPYQSPFDEGGESPALSSSFGQSYGSTPMPDFALGSGGDGGEEIISPSADSNGKGFHHHDNEGDYEFAPSHSLNGTGPVLPSLEEMQPEEGFILREWKRMNAMRLEEKARNEREALSQIIDAADAFKDEFYEKRRTHCEASKKNNREKEKVFLENQEKFHATADKQYWKAVAELVPHELPTMEVKFRGKDKKKPSVVVNQGPKPGKATDLSRMRQVLLKLKHNPPAHMKPPPPPPAAPAAAAAAAAASGEAPKGAPPAPPADPVPPQRQGSIAAEVGATEE